MTARDRLTAMYVPTSDADETEWEQRLNAVRAEVLREAGTVADELIAGLDRTGDQYAFVKADAYRAYSDRLHELADADVAARGKDTRGAVQVPAGESTQAANFFRPDRVYTRPSSYGRTATFHVALISTPPGGGQRMAFGWKRCGEYDAWADYSSDDYVAWTAAGRDDTTTKGKDTGDATHAPAGESTQPATVEFSDGTVTLSGWDIVELAPDFYGHTFMQIGGWLPEGWEPGSISHGTNHMIRADLPGASSHAHNVNVQIEVKGYGGPRRYMKIQWRHAYDPAKDHRRTGGDA